MATSGNAPVCDFKLAPGQTSDNVAAHTHTHDGSGAHSHSHAGLAGGLLPLQQQHSHGAPGQEHGHTHEIMEHPGKFAERDVPNYAQRDWDERAFTVGIGGPVGSGKTALLLALCQRLRTKWNLGVVTNDIFTREDQEFLVRNSALIPIDRVQAIETGGCPHAAIREDISSNLEALEQLQAKYACEMLFVESGGDNLAASYSSELADLHVYVIDVSGGDKVPRKGGPGISQSDILVINKIDLAPYVGASLEVMQRDAAKMRDGGPTVFTSVKLGQGVEDVIDLIMTARRNAGADGHGKPLEQSAS